MENVYVVKEKSKYTGITGSEVAEILKSPDECSSDEAYDFIMACISRHNK